MQIVAGGFLNTLIKRNNKKDLFMKYKLTPELSSDDWNEFCSRFHFSTTDLPHVQAIYLALFPLVNSYAYYSLEQDLDSVSAAHYAYGFVTLGNGVDEMSELYLSHEQVKEAYIVDCLSLMILSKILKVPALYTIIY